ncbi:dihydroorotate dehydrogenase electron transfer subunit [Chloroflexota bacterium]
MNQVFASVISNCAILPEFKRPGARHIISSQLIWLNCPEIAREAKPGQFVMVRCGEECLLRRPLSIHQVNDDSIAFFFGVWADGKGTEWLAQRRKGDKLDLLGPLGNGYSMYPAYRNLLLVAGGLGIAPLYFLAQEALRKGCSVTLLLGALTAAQLYHENLLPPGIKLFTATNDGTAGEKGVISDFVADYIDWADQVFACGSVGMYLSMAAQPLMKSKPVQVSLEVRMGCGLGICYGCTIKTKKGLKQVCQDGPVFDLDDVLWDELSC